MPVGSPAYRHARAGCYPSRMHPRKLGQPAPAVESNSALVDLQSALDLESFWRACVRLVETRLPHRSCSLMFNIVDFEPTAARHHVGQPRNPDYMPATSLTISGPFLARHPQIKLYTYSQILSEDPDAQHRRLDQEPDPEWTEFVHLAFWRDARPEAVFSIHRPPDQSHITDEEHEFLRQLHPMIEAGLRRLRAVEGERNRRLVYESFLYRMPMAVMFVDAQGEVLFATPEAEKQCARWNRGLRRDIGSDRQLSLPGQVGWLVHEGGGDESPAAIKIRHPALTGLTLKIDRNWQEPSKHLSPCYVLTFVEERTASEAPREPTQRALLLLQQLSPSERRVALLVAKGLRNDEIAEQLCRSRRTVEFQLNSIYRKLEVSSRTQLACALA